MRGEGNRGRIMSKLKRKVIGWAITQEGHLEWHETDAYYRPMIFQTAKEARENLRLGSTADVCRVEIVETK